MLGVGFDEIVGFIREGRSIKKYFLDAMDGGDTKFVEKPCWVPVPTAIDIHERTAMSMIQFFGDTDQDAQATRSAVAAFLPVILHASLEEGDVKDAVAVSMDTFGADVVRNLDGINEKLGEPSHKNVRANVRLLANCLKAFYHQGGPARAMAKTMLTRFVTAVTRGVDVNPGCSVVAWIFRWLCHGMGFAAASPELDRDSPENAPTMDYTAQALLKQTLSEFVKSKHGLCTATTLELHNYFDHPKRRVFQGGSGLHIDQWNQLKNASLALTDELSDELSVLILDFFDASARAKAQRALQGVRTARTAAVGAAASHATGTTRDGAIRDRGGGGGGDFVWRTRVTQQLFTPVEQLSESDNSDGADDTDRRSHYEAPTSLAAQGLISFRFNETSKQVVVRAPALVRLRTASVKNGPMRAHMFEIDQGPGGALVRAPPVIGGQLEAESTFAFIDKRSLVDRSILETHKVVQTFPSHERAWQFLEANLPPDALLVGANVLFKQSRRSGQLRPLFLADRSLAHVLSTPLHTAQPDGKSEYTLADAVLLGPLLNYFGLAKNVYDVLALLTALALAIPDSSHFGAIEEDECCTLDGWTAAVMKRYQQLRANSSTGDTAARKELDRVTDGLCTTLKLFHVSMTFVLENVGKDGGVSAEKGFGGFLDRVPKTLKQSLVDTLKVAVRTLGGWPRQLSFVNKALQGVPPSLFPCNFLSGISDTSTATSDFSFPLEQMTLHEREREIDGRQHAGGAAAAEPDTVESTAGTPVELFGVVNKERDAFLVEGCDLPGAAAVAFPSLRWTATTLARTAAGGLSGHADVLTHGYLLHLGGSGRSELTDSESSWVVQVMSAPIESVVKTWILRTVLQDDIMVPPADVRDVRKRLHLAVAAFSLADTCPFRTARP
jgi:hypothetical protein